jgi:sugar lactone lactonase YvrE
VHAELNLPAGIAFDRAGALYIADTGNGRIRRVDLNGTLTTVIGDGRYNGPGGGFAASEAVLNHPFGVAVMSGGYLVIADTQNNRIRRLVLTP